MTLEWGKKKVKWNIHASDNKSPNRFLLPQKHTNNKESIFNRLSSLLLFPSDKRHFIEIIVEFYIHYDFYSSALCKGMERVKMSTHQFPGHLNFNFSTVQNKPRHEHKLWIVAYWF